MGRRPVTDLDEFRRRFTYGPDKGFEALHWRPLDETNPRGDCEDYALTVAYIMAGGSWRRFWLDQITGRAQIWAGRMPGGGGHAALWYRGRGWTDNTTGEWREAPPLRRWFPVVPPLLAVLMMPWAVKIGLVGAMMTLAYTR